MPDQLTTLTDPKLGQQIDNLTNSYVNFTSELITSTFDALVDSNLKQMESYQEFIKTLSMSVSDYINNTVDDVSMDEVLNFIETLDLDKFKLLGNDANEDESTLVIDDNGILTELDGSGNEIKRDNEGEIDPTDGKGFAERLLGGIFGNTGGTIAKTASSLMDVIDIPTDTKAGDIYNKVKQAINVIDDSGEPGNFEYPTDKVKEKEVNTNFLKAMAIRVQQNKYSFLQDVAQTGLLRTVVTGGYIETGMLLNFKERDTYSKKTKDVSRERTSSKQKIRGKQKMGFLPFFKNKSRRKSKQKNMSFQVQKTKTNQKEVASAEINFDARVHIDFKTDYKPLA